MSSSSPPTASSDHPIDFTTNLTETILNSFIENVTTSVISTTTPDYYSEYDSATSELPLGGMTEEEFFASLPVFDMFPLSFPTNSHVVLYAMVRKFLIN
uniref:Uncharacterized protein n=1 Tax=Panagrolaimus sp. PS1159 TaxID=55785 RepID=A0AC35FTB7_9BILA